MPRGIPGSGAKAKTKVAGRKKASATGRRKATVKAKAGKRAAKAA